LTFFSRLSRMRTQGLAVAAVTVESDISKSYECRLRSQPRGNDALPGGEDKIQLPVQALRRKTQSRGDWGIRFPVA
jgi:hypothetical protein